MRNIIFLFIVIAFVSRNSYSQSSVISENSRLYETVDRLLIKYRPNVQIHTSLKPYSIDDIVHILVNLIDSTNMISPRDINDLEIELMENIDWVRYIYDVDKYHELLAKLDAKRNGILKYLYKSPSSMYAGHHKDFFIKVDPVIYLQFGKDLSTDEYNFRNTRGFKISGLLDKKIYFYSSLFETQQSFLPHVIRRINQDLAIPGQAFHKKYQSSVLKNVNGYDFLNAQAYIGFKATKNLKMQLGHGKFNLGDGIRSLLLSDFATNYYYLKFDTRVWKFHYQNIFAELSETSHEKLNSDILIPKKYMATHYLSFKPNRYFEIGVFESVIFSRNTQGSNQFELQYLNPIILYRTVEQFIGSGDNVLVGLNWKYNLKNRFSLYGQVLLDEFNFTELKKGQNWWANKYGFQFGLKYIDVLNIDHLDLQMETNIVRPYTYSHRDSILSYSHYNQQLAHPLGANFNEFLILLKYSPIKRLTIRTKALFALKGEDFNGYSYGGNILISNKNRPIDKDGNIREYGFEIGEGSQRKIIQYSFNTSYMFYHNYYLDLNTSYRNEVYSNNSLNFEELYFSLGLRVNIDHKPIDY